MKLKQLKIYRKDGTVISKGDMFYYEIEFVDRNSKKTFPKKQVEKDCKNQPIKKRWGSLYSLYNELLIQDIKQDIIRGKL